MIKTRDCLKKNGDIKGPFHLRMNMIKDRNIMEPKDEDIKKRWQGYTK